MTDHSYLTAELAYLSTPDDGVDPHAHYLALEHLNTAKGFADEVLQNLYGESDLETLLHAAATASDPVALRIAATDLQKYLREAIAQQAVEIAEQFED